jgi:hypothetical protein
VLPVVKHQAGYKTDACRTQKISYSHWLSAANASAHVCAILCECLPEKLTARLSNSQYTCQTHTTPVKLRHLLHEIILVDDGSTAPHLQQPLEDYVATLPVPVHIVRQGGRTGLMKARVAGARRASGVTLTFLDSHIDCSVDWLEPLMYRIWQVRLQLVQAS